jgi:phosphopantothenate-cysteine ligase/phosphopantothenoylcysteine decarboxylase/phosphopantothenate--cysteine ligase
MRILVTAGNTQTPIDKVRCITNIFSGRTGTLIALEAWRRGHDVHLLTSHPEVVGELSRVKAPEGSRWRLEPYRTFDDLQRLMESEITGHNLDTIIHVAAVSDYAVAATYSLADNTTFDPETLAFQSPDSLARLVDARDGKVRSNHSELWLRLAPTPKLVDQIRRSWGFRGTLVKFKLEVGASEDRLREISEASRRHSDADMVVANTLEGMNQWALINTRHGDVIKVQRTVLPQCVIQAIECGSFGRTSIA